MPLKKTIVSGYSKTENPEAKPAFFLDRDGVINIDHGYVYQTEKLEFLENLGKVLKELSSKYLLIVVTNQSGIARKYFSIDDVFKFHDYLNQKLKSEYNVIIDAFYICPDHPKFSKNCECRKPETGLLEEAVKDFNIDLENSIMIGDKESDIECANNFGIKSIQLLGQYDRSEKADYSCSNWSEVEKLLRSMKLI